GRAVRALDDDRGPYARRVLRGDLILARGEDEDVARKLEQLGVRDPLAALPVRERAMLRDVLVERGHVEPALVEEPARDVGDGDHARAVLVQLRGGDAADVAESLHHAPLPREFAAELPARALDHHHDARTRRLAPEDRASDCD